MTNENNRRSSADLNPLIDKIPDSWELARFRNIFELKKSKNSGLKESNVLSLSYGSIIRRDVTTSEGLLPASFETYQIIDKDDLVFRFTDLQNDKRSLRTARATERGIITSAYMAVQARGINAKYAEYLFRAYDSAKIFYSLGGGVRQSLKFADVSALTIPIPPIDTQKTIASYLYRETQKIDELISEQRSLIETLRERRRSLSEHVFGAVVPGELRLRWSLVDVDERAGGRALELPLLSVSIDWGVRRRRAGDSKQSEGDLAKYKVARAGDIVLNRMRAFQGSLGVAPEDGVVSPDYSVIRTASELDSKWLSEVMRSPSFVGEMVSRIRGIGGVDSGVVRTPRLNFSDLREIRIDVPDIEHQRSTLDSASHQTARIDELIAESEDLIVLSQERRAALITAAVTGQIDVQEMQ